MAPRMDPVVAYYLATPLFAVADFGFHFSVRVTALHAPAQRGAYYAVLFILGLVCRARPVAVPWVGMVESVVNLVLILLAILLPIWSLPDALLSGGSPEGPLTGYALGNAALSGLALVVSFQRQQAAAWRALTGKGAARRTETNL